jgi:non-specific protein-tyrosine kinase
MPDATDARDLELRDYLAVIPRRKVTILVTVAVLVGLAVLSTVLQTPVYEATAEVLVRDDASAGATGTPQPARNPAEIEQRLRTDIEVMRSASVRSAVEEELGYQPKVRITPKGETTVIAVSARDTDPVRAAREATVYAETFIAVRRASTVDGLLATAERIQEKIDELETEEQELNAVLAGFAQQIADAPDEATRQRLTIQQAADRERAEARQASIASRKDTFEEQLDAVQLSAQTTGNGGVVLVSEADVPTDPISPDPVRNIGAALILGLLLGVALAYVREYLDDSLRSKDDLDVLTGGLDVLGMVPQVAAWKNRTSPYLVSLAAPTSPESETYRGLRTSLQFIGVDRPLQLVQITSASPGEGKTTTLANLGVAFARAGHRVLLVDCDLRRPRLHSFFGLSNERGFTSAILGDHAILDTVQPVPDCPRLSVLPSGPVPPNPSELLSTQTAENLLVSLAEHVDYVLIDSPPLLPVSDARILSRYVDGTMLVATVEKTSKRSLGRALELLEQVDAPLVGVVLNGLDTDAAYAAGYGSSSYAEGSLTAGDGLFSLGRRRRSAPASAGRESRMPSSNGAGAPPSAPAPAPAAEEPTRSAPLAERR